MIGLSIGLRAGRAGAAPPPPPPPPPATPASFAMTQLAAPYRVYQRDTTGGGGQSKGQGVVGQTINVTQAGTLYARCRSAVDGSVVQAPWLAIANCATGSGARDIPGVDARLGWFYLDLSGDGTTWVNGTVPIGMGVLALIAGQSLVVRFLRAYSNEDTTTIAGAGVTISPNSRILASGDAANGNVPTSWDQAADGTTLNGAGAPELLARMVALSGVNCGLIGRGEGSTSIAQWQPGTTYGDALIGTLQAAGSKCEVLIWYQGHADSSGDATVAYYQGKLDTFFAGLAANNGFASPVKLVATIGTLTTTGFGGLIGPEVIRRAASDWAAANGGTYVPLQDIQLGSDGVHALQAGSVRTARHFYRALRPHFGASHDDKGAVLGAPTHAAGSADIVIPFTLPAGATALSLVGTAAAVAQRFKVYKRGNRSGELAFDGTTPLAIDNAAKTITLKLSGDPGQINLDVLPFAMADPTADGTAALIVDDLVDGDGLTQGRPLYASVRPGRIHLSRDLAMGGSPTYGAGRFGSTLTAGYGSTPGQVLPSAAEGWRIEFSGKVVTPDTDLKLFCGSDGRFWIGVQGNDLRYQVGGSSGTLSNVFTTGTWRHVAFNLVAPYTSNSQFEIVVDGTSQGFFSGSGFSNDSPLGIRNYGGGNYVLTTQLVDEVALWRETWPTGMPSVAYGGSEPGLIGLWHLDGDGLNSAVAA